MTTTVTTKTTRTKRRRPVKAGTYDEVRQQLQQQREETLRRMETAREELALALAEAGTEQGLGDEGEGGSSAVAVDQLRTLLASSQDRLETIETVLQRIEDGTYGTCSTCHDLIPAERLEALPTANECVRCKAGGLRHRR